MASNRNTAAPAIGRAQPVSSLIMELEEDLALQRAIVASLHVVEPKTTENRLQLSQARQEILTIGKRLAAARGQSRDTIKPEPGSSTPSVMSSPEHSRVGTPLSFNRKRSFGSSHLGGTTNGRLDPKSRRAGAFSSQANSSDDESTGGIPIIDLTGDDEDMLKRQQEEAERHRRNKEVVDMDMNLARQLAGQHQSQFDGFDVTPFLQSSGFRAMREDLAGPSAESTPTWAVPGGVRPGPARANNVCLYGPSASGFGSMSSFPSTNGRLPSMMPSSVKTEPSSFNSYVKQEHKPSMGSSSFHVPGAWMADDDQGTSVFGSLAGPSSYNHHPYRPSPPTSLQFPERPVGIGPPAVARPFGSGPAFAQRAQQSGGLPQPGGTSSVGFPQYGSMTTAPSGLLSSSASSLNRPGYLANGSYIPNPLPSFGDLGAIINRTNAYDWEKLIDGTGEPLNSRIVGFVQDYVEDPRKTAAEIQTLLSNIRPDMDIPVEERGETPEALRYPLYAHQQLALKWMTEMETGTNKGGILADDMGLGKTISALALMVSRKSPNSIKTNLIIGPVALIKQWEVEIKKKLKESHKMNVLLLHQKKKITYDQLKNYDVVLTTYGSIASEWKQFHLHIEQKKGGEGYEIEGDEELHKKCPLIHPRSRFHRIILDEAQCIKNKDTQGSKACHMVEATYRWCLTGTPMMNGVSELFPLIRFLRIRPYNSQKTFTDAFRGLTAKSKVTESQKTDSLRKLQAVLKAIMLRRMKTSKIDGKPILELPPKTKHDDFVTFSEDERRFYQDLEARSQVQFNKYLRQGTIGKNYSNILVLLLRLRQAACHPHLMDFECVATNDISEDHMLKLAKTLESSVVDRIKAIDAFECPICYDVVEDPTLIIPCGHDSCSECFTSITDNAAQGNLRDGNENSQARCPVCRGPIDTAKIINYTAFQKVHMPEKTGAAEGPASEPEVETDSESDLSSDSDDEADSDGNLKGFVVSDNASDDADDDENLDAELTAAVNARQARKAAKTAKIKAGKAKAKSVEKQPKKKRTEKVQPHQLGALRQEAGKNKEARRRYMHYLRDNWEDSAKVTRVVELLTEIQETNEKTIIFSQWTSLLDLIECQVRYKLGLKLCRYTGAMTRQQRDDAVEDFVQNPRNTIMLVSLRAGNAGLNLTVASRIIICDPFWNPYIEMQAVDRAHRIGQQREVKVHRILVQETVEDRILQLQENKRDLVEAALDEGEMRTVARLSEHELRYLFGVNPL